MAIRSVLASDHLNLERINFLIIDDNPQSLDIIASSLLGFGVRQVTKCLSAEEARVAVGKAVFDFIITDAQMPGESGYDFVRWLRKEASEPNRFAPVLLCTGHTRLSQVMEARDCGAHFIVAKPVTPTILFERIFWVARDERAFIECDAYCGPDRRFRRQGPPVGTTGRRRDDLKGAIGEATEPNMSQDEIDSFMKPAKVAL